MDKNGSEFASDVLKNSKEIQSGLKLSPFETASMTAAMGIPDNAAVKMRLSMNNSKGWNMRRATKKC